MTAVLPDTGLIERLGLNAPGCMDIWSRAVECGATPVTHRLIHRVCPHVELLCAEHARRWALRIPDSHSYAYCCECRRDIPVEDFRVVPL